MLARVSTFARTRVATANVKVSTLIAPTEATDTTAALAGVVTFDLLLGSVFSGECCH